MHVPYCQHSFGTKSPYKIGDMNKRRKINKLNGRNKNEITKQARNTNRYREIQRGCLILQYRHLIPAPVDRTSAMSGCTNTK